MTARGTLGTTGGAIDGARTLRRCTTGIGSVIGGMGLKAEATLGSGAKCLLVSGAMPTGAATRGDGTAAGCTHEE